MKRLTLVFLPVLLLITGNGLAQNDPVVIASEPYLYSAPLKMSKDNDSYHPLIYLGLSRDTLFFEGMLWVYPPEDQLPDRSLINKNPEDYRYPTEGDLRIFVYPELLSEASSPFWYGNDSMITYLCFPLVIESQVSDTVIIGYGNHVDLTLEAKDDNNNWHPVEIAGRFEKREPNNALILPPNGMAMSLVLRFDGPLETDLRLRMGENYSETFRGWINPEAMR